MFQCLSEHLRTVWVTESPTSSPTSRTLVGYCPNVVVNTDGLAQGVARERPLTTGGCENVDVMDYVRRDASLDSRRFGVLLVKGQSVRITLGGRSPTSAYGTWKMRMSEWEMSAVHISNTVKDMSYIRVRGERGYLLTLDGTSRDLGEGQMMRPTILAYCCLDAPSVTF